MNDRYRNCIYTFLNTHLSTANDICVQECMCMYAASSIEREAMNNEMHENIFGSPKKNASSTHTNIYACILKKLPEKAWRRCKNTHTHVFVCADMPLCACPHAVVNSSSKGGAHSKGNGLMAARVAMPKRLLTGDWWGSSTTNTHAHRCTFVCTNVAVDRHGSTAVMPKHGKCTHKKI